MQNELGDLLIRLTKRLHHFQKERLAPLGLTPSQSRALRVIVGSGPLRMVDLAERLGVVPRSVTSLVDALEEAGLATRSPDPANRRSLLVEATDRGRAARAEMAAVRREAAERVLAPLDAGQRATLLELLTVMDAGDGPCARPPLAD
ncbi:MarR family winged helix-turn-helix transcriptional regulator [Actinomadura parmotrematis]|uniref:MarR family transcriptional regulator n=1 Tax=Actinomadura parmotrematis TaxID=2864039 RepID=A0ABS7G1U3_9ACTN|nr:MarR family transcriptional regulator [Actinomadura parmotrematis]MBW8486682.1 MarR family transcriptional regulator [Actinomadura parmotrematis]